MSREAVDLAQVLTRHVLKHVGRELEPHKADLGRVVNTDPLRVKITGKNLILHADDLYWGDRVPSNLQVGDWLGLTVVEGSYVVSDRVGLGTDTPYAVPGYTVTGGYTAVRTLDPETAEVADLANVLATLIDDLKAAGIIRGEAQVNPNENVPAP
jgi:hypothetical protein